MEREGVLTVDKAIKFGDSRIASVTESKELVRPCQGYFNKDGMECHYGYRCPYISGGDIRRLVAERNYLLIRALNTSHRRRFHAILH